MSSYLDHPKVSVAEACEMFGVKDYSKECEGLYWGRPEWPLGAMWESEGLVLYSIVRTLKPKVIVEYGRNQGCSTNYLTMACHQNGCGHVFSVDIEELRPDHKLDERLSDYLTIIKADALEYQLPEGTDFIYEDAAHSYGFNKNLMLKLKAELPEGTPVVSHDVAYEPIYKANTEVLGEGICVQPPYDPEASNWEVGIGLWRT